MRIHSFINLNNIFLVKKEAYLFIITRNEGKCKMMVSAMWNLILIDMYFKRVVDIIGLLLLGIDIASWFFFRGENFLFYFK